ncbi:hypothetical protein SDC9_166987 [bioreactor metagenome]|uniref:Uncharacterized protein n=1 Tax=bioreactor metagenome TaxID=1076179 RepID=A0A645FYW3_9ZZZZ
MFQQQLCAAREHAFSGNDGFDAAPRNRAEGIRLVKRQIAAFGCGYDCPRDGVLRSAFGGSCNCENGRFVQLRIEHNVGYFRLALRDGAGFVEHDGADAMRGFERLAALDQNAKFRAFAGADHDGRRRGEPQRAWARDDEHGHKDVEHEVEVFADKRPDYGGGNRNADDRGHEVA